MSLVRRLLAAQCRNESGSSASLTKLIWRPALILALMLIAAPSQAQSTARHEIQAQLDLDRPSAWSNAKPTASSGKLSDEAIATATFINPETASEPLSALEQTWQQAKAFAVLQGSRLQRLLEWSPRQAADRVLQRTEFSNEGDVWYNTTLRPSAASTANRIDLNAEIRRSLLDGALELSVGSHWHSSTTRERDGDSILSRPSPLTPTNLPSPQQASNFVARNEVSVTYALELGERQLPVKGFLAYDYGRISTPMPTVPVGRLSGAAFGLSMRLGAVAVEVMQTQALSRPAPYPKETAQSWLRLQWSF